MKKRIISLLLVVVMLILLPMNCLTVKAAHIEENENKCKMIPYAYRAERFEDNDYKQVFDGPNYFRAYQASIYYGFDYSYLYTEIQNSPFNKLYLNHSPSVGIWDLLMHHIKEVSSSVLSPGSHLTINDIYNSLLVNTLLDTAAKKTTVSETIKGLGETLKAIYDCEIVCDDGSVTTQYEMLIEKENNSFKRKLAEILYDFSSDPDKYTKSVEFAVEGTVYSINFASDIDTVGKFIDGVLPKIGFQCTVGQINNALTFFNVLIEMSNNYDEAALQCENYLQIMNTVTDDVLPILYTMKTNCGGTNDYTDALEKVLETYIKVIESSSITEISEYLDEAYDQSKKKDILTIGGTALKLFLSKKSGIYKLSALTYDFVDLVANVEDQLDYEHIILYGKEFNDVFLKAMSNIHTYLSICSDLPDSVMEYANAYLAGLKMHWNLMTYEQELALVYYDTWLTESDIIADFGYDRGAGALDRYKTQLPKQIEAYQTVYNQCLDVIASGSKIQYYLGDNVFWKTEQRKYGNPINLSWDTPEKDGYVFSSWRYMSKEYSPGAELSSAVLSNGVLEEPCFCSDGTLIFYAKWDDSNSIIYNANGGTNAPKAEQNTIGVNVLSTQIPDWTGYVFLGWSEDPNATSADYSAGGELTKEGTVILYAIWSPKTFNVIFDANGGMFANAQTTQISKPKQYNQSFVIDVEKPVKDGYVFSGQWEFRYSNGKKDIYDHNPTKSYYDIGDDSDADKVLYAVWTKADTEAEVLYDYGDDPSGENVTKIIDKVDTSNGPVSYSIKNATAMQSYNGNSFKGWIHSDPNGSLWWANAWADNGKYTLYRPGDQLTVSGDTELYAKWTWLVHYDMGDGQYAHAEVGNNSMYSVAAPTCTKEGKVFVRWEYTDANGATVACQPGEQVWLYSDLYLTAVWREAGDVISGTVKDATVNGANYGKPIEGAIVEFFDSTGASVGAVLSDAEGVFSFEFMKNDTYQYSLTKPGYKSVTIDSLIINENTPSMGVVTMVEDADSLIVDGGKCGDLAAWILSKEKSYSSAYDLFVVGAGDIYDYEYHYGGPWNEYESMIRHITIEDSITRIGECAFYGIYGNFDSEISLSKNLRTIGQYAFAYCGLGSALTINLPAQLEIIESDAFSNSRFTSIEIPASVTSIGYNTYGALNNPFVSSFQLAEILVDENNANYCSKDGVLYTKDMKTLIAYPEGKKVDILVIPDTVDTICEQAFGSLNYTVELKNIYIPSQIDELDAFAEVPVEALTVAEGNPYFCSVDGVVYSKDKKTIELYPCGNPAILYQVLDGTETLGCGAFMECNNLITLDLPGSLTKIDQGAIQLCDLLSNLIIPSSVTWLGSHALSQCNSLTDIYFMGNVPNTFDYQAIYHYQSIDTVLHYIDGKEGWTTPTITKGCRTFKTATFDPTTLDLSIVKSGVCGEGITWTINQDGVLTISGQGAITDYAYSNNTPWHEFGDVITKIVINSGITRIGNHAFVSCERLESVSFSNTVTSIGESAFSACLSLKDLVLPEKLQTIGAYAFMQCEGLTNIEIPNSVTSIGAGAFCNCKSLVSVDLPDKLQAIEEKTFDWCRSLVTIDIPQSVNSIGKQAFYQCEQLLRIIVPDGVDVIYDETFSGCDSLTSIVLPRSIKSIGNRAFESCRSLSNLVLPDSLESLGNYAFSGCKKISSIAVPGGIETIKDHTFVSCDNLESVIIKNGVKSIENSAFSHCTSLATISLPKTLNSIGDWSFWSCSSLKDIVLPDGLTTIGKRAFCDCSTLESMIIPATVQSIGEYSFADTDGLISMYFCGDVPSSLGYGALGWTGSFTIYYVPGTSGWTTPTWRAPSDGTLFNTATWRPKRDTAVSRVNVTESKTVVCTLNETATDVKQVLVGAYVHGTNKFIGAATGEYSSNNNTVTVTFTVSLPETYELKVFCTDSNFAPLYKVSTFSQGG